MITITFKATPEEKAAYTEAAKSLKTPLSTWIRNQLNNACEPTALETTQDSELTCDELDKALVGEPTGSYRDHVYTPPTTFKFACPRCKRIGTPTCNDCRKLNKVK